ncbi:MAG TPA: cohesin domain-containing protein [bacterium]|nr:cohesin domain-containing protein [bacterium]HOL35085.1 cohesin domain-containing protein [bacterium]HPP07866.1 cohesin domain-containing protein [bacterium]
MKTLDKSHKAILISLLVFVLTIPAWSTTVSIPNTIGKPSSAVEVPINIDNATGITGFQCTITYDTAVVVVSKVKSGSITANWTIASNLTIPGQIKIAGFDPNLTGPSTTSGSLAIIEFSVVGSLGSSTQLRFTDCKLSNKMGGAIPVTTVDGSFKVGLKGDINQDGFLDITDVILCLRMVIELDITVGGQSYSSPYTEELKWAADMNNDGIDITDVISMLRKAISLS